MLYGSNMTSNLRFALLVAGLYVVGAVPAIAASPAKNVTNQIGPKFGRGPLTKLSLQHFERATGVHYLRKLPFGYRNLADEPIGSAKMSELPREANRAAVRLRSMSDADLRALYGGKLRRGVTASMYLAKVPEIDGLGVFADKVILPGRMIGEFTGDHVVDVADPKYSVLLERKEDGKKVSIDARHRGNLTRWINHSNYPNAEIKLVTLGGVRHAIVVAIAPILAHQQIFLDYGGVSKAVSKELPRSRGATAPPPSVRADPYL